MLGVPLTDPCVLRASRRPSRTGPAPRWELAFVAALRQIGVNLHPAGRWPGSTA